MVALNTNRPTWHVKDYRFHLHRMQQSSALRVHFRSHRSRHTKGLLSRRPLNSLLNRPTHNRWRSRLLLLLLLLPPLHLLPLLHPLLLLPLLHPRPPLLRQSHSALPHRRLGMAGKRSGVGRCRMAARSFSR